MVYVVDIIAALIPTYLFSRLFAWLLKKRWDNWSGRIVAAHVLSAAVCCFLMALSHSDFYYDGSLNKLDWSMSYGYLIAQLIWFTIEFKRGQLQISQAPRH